MSRMKLEYTIDDIREVEQHAYERGRRDALEELEEFTSAKMREILDDCCKRAADRIAQWIPVTKELPTLNDDGVSDMVLLCWSDGQRTVGAYRGDRTFVGQAWPEAKDVRVTVTAWQPLPEPYRESEE